MVPLREDEALSAGPWDMSALVGLDLDPRRCVLHEMNLLEGRQMTPGATGEALLGYAAAEKQGKRVGDVLEVRGLRLTVVGVLDLVGTDPDNAVFTSVEDARKAAYGLLRDSEVSAFALRIEPGADEQAIRRGVEQLGGGRLRVMTPDQIRRSVSTTTALINSVLYGCAIIAILVGTLGTANTMTMSVGERAREIATKKAIGAATTDIFREFLAEAIVISLAGAVVGIGFGCLGVLVLNKIIATKGLPLFLITPRLLGIGGGVALIVGALAGVLPALQAARVDPVRILRNA